MFRYRDRTITAKVAEQLKRLNLSIRLMHVCGTHQDTIVRFGLNPILQSCGVDMRQGPGCPVCVTPAQEYEEAVTLGRRGKTIATYGDAARVPGREGSLLDLRAKGCDVKVVYGIEDAVGIAKRTGKQTVFLAVGFETTAPATAATLLSEPPENFSILCCHRYVPPALHALLQMGEVNLHGLVEPGHVSTVIGLKPYEEIAEKYKVPQVVAGFEPLDMLMAVYMLAQTIKKGEVRVLNEYTRSVRYEGNVKALACLREVFEPYNAAWRGFPIIPNSGMNLRSKYERYDARKIFEADLEDRAATSLEEPKGCRCGEIIRGLVEPRQCTLFGRACTPQRPVGPCMVSVEGSCNIEYKYGQRP